MMSRGFRAKFSCMMFLLMPLNKDIVWSMWLLALPC